MGLQLITITNKTEIPWKLCGTICHSDTSKLSTKHAPKPKISIARGIRCNSDKRFRSSLKLQGCDVDTRIQEHLQLRYQKRVPGANQIYTKVLKNALLLSKVIFLKDYFESLDAKQMRRDDI